MADPAVMKAGAFAAAAFVLLVPTFNALNDATFEPRDPGIRITPPPDFVPPDMEPPDGDHEFDGDMDVPIPPGSCPDPTVREEEVYSDSFGGGLPLLAANAGDTTFWEVERGALGIGVAVGFEDYVGGFTFTATDPQDDAALDETAARPEDGPRSDQRSWFVEAPASGSWSLTWDASGFTGGGGIAVYVAYPDCNMEGQPRG